jgi:hypoxanthine phosphoribosyltransferase
MENCTESDLRLLYSEERILSEVGRLADEISTDYAGHEITLLVVLKGAFFFAADLARRIRLPMILDFVRLSSYSGTETTGEVALVGDIGADIAGKHVILVEDIVDTGLSLSFLLRGLSLRGPKSLRVCVLLDKRGRRRAEVSADYTGIVCDDGFLVGYGLDYDERCRELPAIYEMVTNPSSGGLNDCSM